MRFTPPEYVDFFLTRGPVPHVRERFSVEPLTAPGRGEATRLGYAGELATDLWSLGARWADLVAAPWQRTVAATFEAVKAEAERRSSTASTTL